MQRKIDQRESGVIRQSEAQRRLYARRYYLNLDARLCWDRHGAAKQTQYPGLDLANVVKHDGRRVAQSLTRQNAPYCISVIRKVGDVKIFRKPLWNFFFFFFGNYEAFPLQDWSKHTCWSVEKLPPSAARSSRYTRR